MNKPSLKKFISSNIGNFLDKRSELGLENNRIIFYTPIGVIEGDYIDKGIDKIDELDSEYSILATICEGLYDEYVETYESEKSPLPGDDGFLILKDVVIRNSNNTFRIPSFILFYDQIIGISIGNIDL